MSPKLYYYIESFNSLRMSSIKKTTINSIKDFGGVCIAGRNINLTRHYGNVYEGSSKTKTKSKTKKKKN